MIIITKVETVETEIDPIRLPIYDKDDMLFPPHVSEPLPTKTYLEIIKGREFIKSNGERIFIGMRNEAEEVLGIYYDAWDELHKQINGLYRCIHSSANVIDDTRMERNEKEKEIEKIKSYGFWKRLKCLFVGIH